MAAYDWDPNVIFGQAPRTNVGIVSLGNNQYVAPRDPRAKDLLNYASPSTPIVYDRPEELEFAPDPNEPGIYNTELNPYDPSSKFFPYEPDYAGIMSLANYSQQEGDIGVDAKTHMEFDPERIAKEFYDEEGKLVLNPKEGQLMYDKSGTPLMEDNYGTYYSLGDPKLNISQNLHNLYGSPPQLGYKDIEEVRDTLFHEGKHYFIDNFGRLVPKAAGLSDEHKAIYFADMFRKNPFWRTASGAINPKMMVNKPSALAFMQMHNLGKKWSQDKKPLQTDWSNTLEQINAFADPNDTVEQVFNQIQAYEDKDRGNYQAPTMTQQQMVQEAQQTGGTVNPHEMTKAAARAYVQPTPSPSPSPSRPPSRSPSRPPSGPRGQGARRPRTAAPPPPRYGPHGAQGGLVSINHITRRL